MPVPQIVSLAYVNQLVHQFLVSSAERFRLRLYVLGRGFGLASRFLVQSTQRIASGTPAQDREWDQIQAIREDFQTLTDLRVLLTSLAQQDRDTLLDRL